MTKILLGNIPELIAPEIIDEIRDILEEIDNNYVNSSYDINKLRDIKDYIQNITKKIHYTKTEVDSKIPISTSDLVNDSGFLTSHQDITQKVNISDIKDNLTSTDIDKPLSAKQGKVLKDLIGDAITYINQ